ncbi:6440_t:CDS:2, partial [Funneliformis geosporum]
AFDHLDDLINSQNPSEYSKTYMKAIMEKVFPNELFSNNSTAYIMAIVFLFLDPHSGTDELNENVEDSD